MKKDEIFLGDIKRILLGNAPAEFLLETLMRTTVMYVVLLVVLRFMGKRMSGQLTITELAIMLTLGAIVSGPMQMPDKGILEGMLVLFCAFIFQRQVNLASVKHKKLEELTQGKLSILIKDGLLQLDEMKKVRVSHQQLFSTLRTRQIFNLGKVNRLYMETCGLFSVYQLPEPKPGLPLLPPKDKTIIGIQEEVDKGNLQACCNCGYVAEKKDTAVLCDNCGVDDWTNATIEIK